MRFVTFESEGRYTLLGSAKQPGITVTVHDTALLYKTIKVFRTEHGPGLIPKMSHWERRRVVREQAALLCERLNREVA